MALNNKSHVFHAVYNDKQPLKTKCGKIMSYRESSEEQFKKYYSEHPEWCCKKCAESMGLK